MGENECFVGKHGEAAMISRMWEHIADIGWGIVGVMPSENFPAFHYTVGLTLLNHPEIIIVGNFPSTPIAAVINTMGEKIKLGKVFTAGNSSEVLERYTVPIRTVTPHALEEHFGICRTFFGDNQYRALQVFMPDRNGKFPHDPDCDIKFALTQINLCEAHYD